jgi:hypothetical protein
MKKMIDFNKAYDRLRSDITMAISNMLFDCKRIGFNDDESLTIQTNTNLVEVKGLEYKFGVITLFVSDWGVTEEMPLGDCFVGDLINIYEYLYKYFNK